MDVERCSGSEACPEMVNAIGICFERWSIIGTNSGNWELTSDQSCGQLSATFLQWLQIPETVPQPPFTEYRECRRSGTVCAKKINALARTSGGNREMGESSFRLFLSRRSSFSRARMRSSSWARSASIYISSEKLHQSCPFIVPWVYHLLPHPGLK